MCFLGSYIVCICSRTSRRPNTLQDINNMLHIECMPAEQLEWQRFNWSMGDVLYEVLDSVHMLLDQLKGEGLAKL